MSEACFGLENNHGSGAPKILEIFWGEMLAALFGRKPIFRRPAFAWYLAGISLSGQLVLKNLVVGIFTLAVTLHCILEVETVDAAVCLIATPTAEQLLSVAAQAAAALLRKRRGL